jgi:hypothetical protein
VTIWKATSIFFKIEEDLKTIQKEDELNFVKVQVKLCFTSALNKWKFLFYVSFSDSVEQMCRLKQTGLTS